MLAQHRPLLKLGRNTARSKSYRLGLIATVEHLVIFVRFESSHGFDSAPWWTLASADLLAFAAASALGTKLL